MIYDNIDFEHIPANISLSEFRECDGAVELYAMISPRSTCLPFETQLEVVDKAIDALVAGRVTPFFVRYFISDPVNQMQKIVDRSYAVSVVGQAPLSGCKVAALACFIQDVETHRNNVMTLMRHSAYEHIMCTGIEGGSADPCEATKQIFAEYNSKLSKLGCTVADNCMRTWLFVRDIDTNYPGVVKGRNEMFDTFGLTPQTHFIASTGIAGQSTTPKEPVHMDAYAVRGLQSGQVRYLKAATHLNPTAEYGVAFERGTAIDYGDRRHVFISGTASINNKGEIVHPGDVELQCKRMLENIAALADEADCRLHDMAYIIVYLRDIADHDKIEEMFDNILPDVPRLLVHAAVCRPGWLIEAECFMVRSVDDSIYPPF